MRKSRFLLGLIAATAIGLSTMGCESSDEGAIGDTSDITVPGNNNQQQERANLHEYMLVGQRGLIANFTPSFNAGQSAPSEVTTDVVAAPGDDDGVDPAELYELVGIANQPQPNANLLGPGGAPEPSVPGAARLEGLGTFTGFHEVYPSPTGSFAIGLSRARNRGFAGDSVSNATLEIYTLRFAEPLDVTFPPNIIFGRVAAPVDVFLFPPNQGEFVSGTWSTDARQFYASIDGGLTTYSVDGNIGDLRAVDTLAFPQGVAGINNAVKVISSPNGANLYALDNANAQIVTYARNAGSGVLSEVSRSPVVSDPRGATLDRSGRYMYVVGRASEQVAGYRVEADGSLTPFDLFPNIGLGPVPFNFGAPLGDIDANPVSDQLFLATYRGLLQGYNIDSQTGALSAVGQPDAGINLGRNSANIEVEPTGRFVLTANEHDFESFQGFVNQANGFPFDESLVFANTDSANNGDGRPALSATPNLDNLGRIVYVLPVDTAQAFTGNLQVSRIAANGTVRAEASTPVENPYGLSFFQQVLTPPASAGPVLP